jgi:SAM-dependent methyltransferase
MKYPDEWQGTVPESLQQVKAGRGQVTVNSFHSLAWIEHFGFPVWKPFEKLQVRDVACGTGENALVSALVHSGAQYLLSEDDEESLAQARLYAEQLELGNVRFADSEATEAADILVCTRPLNQIEDLPRQLKTWATQIAAGGVIELQCDTDPVTNGIKAARERINYRIETELQTLVEAAWAELQTAKPAGEWTIPYLNDLITAAGLKIFTFLHPQMYDPQVYLPEGGELLQQKMLATSLLERAMLAEILAGGIRRHTFLCVPLADERLIPTIDDGELRSLIPFRSPYAEMRRENGQVFFQVERWALPINDAVPMGEVCAPESMAAIYSAIDGKKTFEQLHRRFLPLPWDVFLHFMKLLAENGLLHLHREEK